MHTYHRPMLKMLGGEYLMLTIRTNHSIYAVDVNQRFISGSGLHQLQDLTYLPREKLSLLLKALRYQQYTDDEDRFQAMRLEHELIALLHNSPMPKPRLRNRTKD